MGKQEFFRLSFGVVTFGWRVARFSGDPPLQVGRMPSDRGAVTKFMAAIGFRRTRQACRRIKDSKVTTLDRSPARRPHGNFARVPDAIKVISMYMSWIDILLRGSLPSACQYAESSVLRASRLDNSFNSHSAKLHSMHFSSRHPSAHNPLPPSSRRHNLPHPPTPNSWLQRRREFTSLDLFVPCGGLVAERTPVKRDIVSLGYLARADGKRGGGGLPIRLLSVGVIIAELGDTSR